MLLSSLVVVELELGEGLADIAVVDPFLHVELLHAAEILQHLDVVAAASISSGLMVGSVGHVAAGAEEDVDDFLVDAGPFLRSFQPRASDRRAARRWPR